MADLPTRRRAIASLEEQRDRTLELLERVPGAAFITPGLGGGTWSPRDLLGHLTSWEEYALDAMAAWMAGERAAIDELQGSLGLNAINRQDVERKASWAPSRIRREAERVHRELITAIQSVGEATWREPATPRARRPLGLRLGAILGGPAGPFLHEEAHHPSVRSFLAAQGVGPPSASGSSARRRSSR